MVAQKRREGIERVEWLLTTIDWLTRYDDACLKMAADGPLGTLLKEAQAAQAKGDFAANGRPGPPATSCSTADSAKRSKPIRRR